LFWSVFDRSQIPMALVDRDRCYVAVNDAGLAVFRFQRDDVIGKQAGRTAIGPDISALDEQWEQLLATNELYGELVVRHTNGLPVRISYAAHATNVDQEWLALFVALSANVEPDGAELIGTSEPATGSYTTAALTRREREVVRRVALGATTRQIASDLFLSPATVRAHVRNAMVKTKARTRAQLVAIVLGDGLTTEKRPRRD
jgi:DNA-binding CsgD family transcriptional regulator